MKYHSSRSQVRAPLNDGVMLYSSAVVTAGIGGWVWWGVNVCSGYSVQKLGGSSFFFCIGRAVSSEPSRSASEAVKELH